MAAGSLGRLVVELAANIAHFEQDMGKAARIAQKQMGEIQRSVAGVQKSFQFLGGVAATALGGFGAAQFVGVLRETDKLRASLETMTGSAEAAQFALGKLQEFVATTPFSIQEVTQAFVRLKALGLDPSMEALTSYGNTASAMGKDLIQFIEAVADAATGEFERLKEFGIKASQQGEKVSFTFRGVTTTVAKNAQAIEQYLQRIGRTDFAGAMERRAHSLDGALSNLGDSFSQLINAVGDAGLTDAIEGTARDEVKRLARPEGLEPPTPWFEARYSIQLSYGRVRRPLSVNSSDPFIARMVSLLQG